MYTKEQEDQALKGHRALQPVRQDDSRERFDYRQHCE